jgi:hypothetical protein
VVLMELNIEIMFLGDSPLRTLVDRYHLAILWVRQLSHLSVPAEPVVQSKASACGIYG